MICNFSEIFGRNIWHESALGADSIDTRTQKAAWQAREKARRDQNVEDMKTRVRPLRANGLAPSRSLSTGDTMFL
jgi:hypothetical protein